MNKTIQIGKIKRLSYNISVGKIKQFLTKNKFVKTKIIIGKNI